MIFDNDSVQDLEQPDDIKGIAQLPSIQHHEAQIRSFVKKQVGYRFGWLVGHSWRGVLEIMAPC